MEVSEICAYIMVLSVLATPILCLIFLIRWIMGKPKKKFGIAILVCMGSFVLSTLIGTDATQGTDYAVPFVCFVILETLLIVPGIKDLKSRRIENIISAKVVYRRLVTRGKHRYSGTSFGWYGGFRSYWRYEQVPSYVEVWADVAYKNGKQRRLYLREGSRKYYRIMAICDKCKDT